MSYDIYAGVFEIKAVDLKQRTIEGHASVFNTPDRVSDIVDPKAFDRTLKEKKPADIGVFIGHEPSQDGTSIFARVGKTFVVE